MKIAIIDDQEEIQYSVSRILKKSKHKTFTFDGFEYDIIFTIKEEDIDLLIVDVMLSEEYSGIDLIKKLRKEGVHKPIILMTAYTTPSNMIEASKIGIKDILQKPFRSEDLLNLVNKYNNTDKCPTTLYLTAQIRMINH